MAKHVYHWKHGWIPLTHTAAMSKAKGDKKAAKKYLDAVDSKHLSRDKHVTAAHREGRVSLSDGKSGHSTSIDADEAKKLHDDGRHITGVNSNGKVVHRAGASKAAAKGDDNAVERAHMDRHGDAPLSKAERAELDTAHRKSTRPQVTKTDVYGDGRIDELTLPSGHKVEVERATGRVTGSVYRTDASGVDAVTANPDAFTKHYAGRSDSHDDHMTVKAYTPPGNLPRSSDGPAPAPAKRMPLSDIDFAVRSGRMSQQQADEYMLKHYPDLPSVASRKGAQDDAPSGDAGKMPEGDVWTDPVTGKPAQVRRREGKLEYRHFPNGAVTIVDMSRPGGSPRVVGHTGPDPAKAFDLPGSGGEPFKPKVGDTVSIAGERNSKVTVAEVRDGRARVQNSFESGAKGTWVPVWALLPYGADTGREKPMGGRAVPGTGVSGSSVRRR